MISSIIIKFNRKILWFRSIDVKGSMFDFLYYHCDEYLLSILERQVVLIFKGIMPPFSLAFVIHT